MTHPAATPNINPKEHTMTQIPTTTDLLNAQDNEGQTVADRILTGIRNALRPYLDENTVDVWTIAEHLTESTVEELADLDLTTFTYDQEN